MTLTFKTHISSYVQLDVDLLLLTFRSLAAIVSEKSTVFTLSFWIWSRRFFKIFTIYGHGGHLGHVTSTIYINFCSPFPMRLHIKFGFDWPSGFREEDVCNCGRTEDGRTP